MTSRKQFSIVGTTTLLLIGAVSVVMAQTPGPGRGASPMYDVKTETTIKGTVESVETVTKAGGRGRRGLGGTHLTVKTEKETLEVHVGPTAYLTVPGDTYTVQVTLEGFKMTDSFPRCPPNMQWPHTCGTRERRLNRSFGV